MTLDPTVHPDDDLAVYALDALEPAERAAIDVHLSTCPACRAELDRHLETLAYLTTDDEVPPASVWLGIESLLPQVRPAAPVAPVAPPPAPGADVLPFDRDRPRHARRDGRSAGRWPTPWLLAAAAAVVVVLGIAAVSLRGAGEPDLAERATAAAEDEGSTVIQLTTATGDAEARVVRSPDGEGYVLLDDLPELPDGETYQLWKMNDTEVPISLGTIGDGTNDAASVGIPTDVTDVAISEEPDGGSPTPQGPIVATGRRAT